MRAIKTIQKELKEHEDLLEFAVEQDEKDFLKDAIKGLKDELKKAEEVAEKKPTEKKVPAKKPAAKTAPKKKDKNFIEVDGKKYFDDDPLFCAKLIEQWEKRKKDHKKAAGKRKTRSIMVQVASSAASTVVKGIKSISHDELEKNAAKEIKKMKRLEAAAKEYVAAYKDIVGEKLTQAEVKEEFEGVSGLINKIETKYVKGTKKKMAQGGETKKTYYLALRTSNKSWDSHKQEEFDGTWNEAVSKAKQLAKENKSEVRLSESKGYNNQGHYFHHQNINN